MQNEALKLSVIHKVFILFIKYFCLIHKHLLALYKNY